jgi:hypothetical protein
MSDRVPLAVVVFVAPTSVPDCPVMINTAEAMKSYVLGGATYVCPQPYLDEAAQKIVIKDREYPMERVHYYVRAKMALSRAKPLDHDYTIGKKAVVLAPGVLARKP